MIKVRMQIDNEAILDSCKGWGLIYIDADKRTAPPEKKIDTTSYAEQEGEHADLRTVADVFDYKVRFAVSAPNKNLKNANSVIARFNDAIRRKGEGDVRTKRRLTFYNDHDRVKIVGYPELIAEPTSFYRLQSGAVMDCAEVELTIHVTNPSECDFDLVL